MRVILLLLALSVSSCKSPTLSVDTGYFTRSDLASVKIGTPDPHKQEPIFGQRLYISWNATKEQMALGPLQLHIKVLLKKGKMLDEKVPLHTAAGTYIFPITGTNYTEEGGLLSYEIALLANDTQLSVSRHKFWVDQINIRDE